LEYPIIEAITAGIAPITTPVAGIKDIMEGELFNNIYFY
jgi:hypothetical protein